MGILNNGTFPYGTVQYGNKGVLNSPIFNPTPPYHSDERSPYYMSCKVGVLPVYELLALIERPGGRASIARPFRLVYRVLSFRVPPSFYFERLLGEPRARAIYKASSTAVRIIDYLLC